MMDPRELVAFAEAAVDQVEPIFRSGIGRRRPTLKAGAISPQRWTWPSKSSCATYCSR